MKNIPKIAHRIWFGSDLPDSYRNNIRELKEKNADYRVVLWSDPQTMLTSDYKNLAAFCNDANIELINIRDHHGLKNYNIILSELDGSIDKDTHKRLHYVRASDIARMAILFEMGGIYTDTDNKVSAPFSQYESEQTLLLKAFTIPGIDEYYNYYQVYYESYQYYFCDILYDFMAASSHHPVIEFAAKITELDYQTLEKSQNKEWINSNNREHLLYGTVKLTGSSLKYALNVLHQQGQFTIESMRDLFVADESITESTYDKSWLEGFEANTTGVNGVSAFLKEIETHREQVYPRKGHGEHPISREQPKRAPNTQSINALSFFLQQQKPERLPEPNLFFKKAPQLNTLEMKLELPKFEFKPQELPRIKLNIISHETIQTSYLKNGGGFFASFYLFNCNPSKTVPQLIDDLKERAKTNPDGASSRTLKELGL